eukprot:gene17205-48951_t
MASPRVNVDGGSNAGTSPRFGGEATGRLGTNIADMVAHTL